MSQSTIMEQLFPVPSSGPSSLLPSNHAGVSAESTAVLRELLQDDYEHHHVFFNDKRFHNHTIHHILTIYSMGSNVALLRAAYDMHHNSIERPAFPSPENISVENFTDHLGDERYYAGYLSFFSSLVMSKGLSATVEEWVFSARANFSAKQEEEGMAQPEMLNRLMSSILHPLIHLGFGLEFNLPGVVAEGLAQTAVHNTSSSVLIPASSFDFDIVATLDSTFSRLTSVMPKMILNTLNQHAPPVHGTHVFSIMSRILRDPRFKVPKDMALDKILKHHGEAIRILASEWTVEGADSKEVARKVEELSYMNVLIYGVGGWKANDRLVNADFFQMHLVTSSIFLPAYVAHLSASSASLLLRTYFTHSLVIWIQQGRCDLDIPTFFASRFQPSTFPGPKPSPSESSLGDITSTLTPNPWLPIIQTTLTHPDDHLPKIQRALAHYARIYGTREAGRLDFKDTELEGAELIDGTLFLRVASMTAEKMGRVREGEEPQEWDRVGFFDEK